MALGWIQATDRLVGRNGAYTDTLNRALRDMLTQSGYNPDAATFPGIAGPVYNVMAFGAKGDGVTDDGPAFNAAKAALPAGGGVIWCPQPPSTYKIATTLNFDGTTGVVLRGPGGPTGGAGASAELDFSGLAYISARSTTAFSIDGLEVRHTNAAFTGDLVDLSHSTATDSSLWEFRRVLFYGAGPTSSMRSLVSTDNAIIGRFSGCTFMNAPVAVLGRLATTNYSNAVTFDGSCAFINIGTMPIRNPGQSWSILGATFEGLSNLTVGAVQCQPGYSANGLVYLGNWHGDASVGKWVEFLGNGLITGGNYFSGNGATIGYSIRASSAAINIGGDDFSAFAAAGVAVELQGAVNGLKIGGNAFGTAMTAPISGLYGFGHTWVDVGANSGTNAPSAYEYAGGAAIVGSATHRSVMGYAQYVSSIKDTAGAFRRLIGFNTVGGTANTVDIAADGDPVNVGGVMTTKLSVASTNKGAQATIANAATFTIAGIPSRRVVLVSIAHNADPNKGRVVMYQYDGVGNGTVTAIADSTAGGIGIAATAPGTLTITNGSGGNSGYAWSYVALTDAVA